MQSANKSLKLFIRVLNIFNCISIIALLFLSLFVALDVFSRNIFNKPFAGSIDVIEITLVIIVYGSLAFCTFHNENIRIELIYSKLPKSIQILLDKFTNIMSTLITALIAYRLAVRVYEITINPPGPTTGYFQWPLLYGIIFAAIGIGILCVVLVLKVIGFNNKKGKGEGV